MADAITSFFQLPQASRIGGSAAAKLAPTALELGADGLTFNARRDTLGKLFTSPTSASNLKNLDSFLSLHAAAGTNAPAPRATGKDALKIAPELKKNDNAALDVFIKRETSAEARLKELLAGTAAAPASATTAAAGEDAASAEPAITRNTGLRVEEGGEGIISNLRLNADFAGARSQDIIYTISDGPRNGQLELASKPGKAVTTFTQQDLNLGRLRYVNNGAESRGDSFDFTVNAGEQELSGSFGISISPVNDTPDIAVNTGVTLDEGASTILSTAQLSASDPDNNVSETTFSVTQGPSNGRLEFTDNAGVSITSFTQADIAAGRVRYVSDGSEVTSDSFNFTATDGSATSDEATFAITLNPVDDAPVQTFNAGATVTEGGSAAITSAQLSASDVDTAAEDLVYTVNSAPTAGRLEFTGNAGTAITSFTQADVNAGRVRYVSDGSEVTTDSFTFTLSDATTGLTAANFNFTINPVDDAPVATTNTGVTVAEGGSTTITAAQLSSTDVDTADPAIAYTVTSGPANGRLEFADNAGVSVSGFTQDDIDSGRLRYVHDGSETSSDSFSFTVSDGTTALSAASFNLTVTPVDDAPTAGNNTTLTAAEGGSATITSARLSTNDVDTAAANITYTVNTGPANGRLEFTDNAGVSVSSFTQGDIDSGRLRYVHNGSETTSDSFTFTASDATTALSSATFGINVTPVDDPPAVTTNTGATVAEGGTRAITSAQLGATDPDTAAANLVYTITSGPANGRLEFNNNPGVAVTSFTQSDINAGHLRFVHDGSETTTASFGFSLSDGNSTVTGNSFVLAVTPVNDAPTAGNNTGASVSWLGSTTITSAQLSTNDVDTAAANISYTVTNATDNGRLELSTNPGVSVTTFTQADIDAGRLRYVHTNFLSVSDQFRYRVSDGDTSLAPRNFNITVN